MDKQLILHKLQKYQTKLKSNPSNYIYQQKVTHYEHMVGGENNWEKNETLNNYIIKKNNKTYTYNSSKKNITKQYLKEEIVFNKETIFSTTIDSKLKYYKIREIKTKYNTKNATWVVMLELLDADEIEKHPNSINNHSKEVEHKMIIDKDAIDVLENAHILIENQDNLRNAKYYILKYYGTRTYAATDILKIMLEFINNMIQSYQKYKIFFDSLTSDKVNFRQKTVRYAPGGERTVRNLKDVNEFLTVEKIAINIMKTQLETYNRLLHMLTQNEAQNILRILDEEIPKHSRILNLFRNVVLELKNNDRSLLNKDSVITEYNTLCQKYRMGAMHLYNFDFIMKYGISNNIFHKGKHILSERDIREDLHNLESSQKLLINIAEQCCYNEIDSNNGCNIPTLNLDK